MRDFHELDVWRKCHELVTAIYKVTKSLPSDEMYSLTSQIRRAAVSITANIAEGCGRNSEADFAHFLQIAFGSASELSYFLLLSKDLNLMDIGIFNALDNQLSECMKMLSGLLKSVRLRINPKPKT